MIPTFARSAPLLLVAGLAAQAQTPADTAAARALAASQEAATLAKSASEEVKSLAAATEATDDRVKVIERLREIEAEEAAAKAKSTPVVQTSASGLLFRSADTAWSIRFRGVIRTGGVWDLNDESHKTVDQIQNSTVRLGFEGALARRVEYRIQADFSKGSVGLQDAYTDLKFAKWAVVRVGKFQTPLGWERFQSPGDLPFFDRALPSTIAPNRDIGVQLSGDVLKGRLNYALAAVNGGADGSNINGDVNDDKDAYLRLWAAPAKGTGLPWLEGLGLGVGGSYGYHDVSLASYRSASGASIFSWYAADSSRGEGWRVAPQLSWTAGPYWVWGEWIRSQDRVAKGATSTPTDSVGKGAANKGVVYRYNKVADGAAPEEFAVTAWQAGISWVVTGEDASEKGVKPRHPFDGSENGGLGALELSARVSGLAVDDAAFPVFADTAKSASAALAWAVAANWHLIRGTRIQVAYERTVFDGGATYVAGQDAKKKDILAVRDRKPENLLTVSAATAF